MTLRRRSVLSLLGLGTAGMVTARVFSEGSLVPLADVEDCGVDHLAPFPFRSRWRAMV